MLTPKEFHDHMAPTIVKLLCVPAMIGGTREDVMLLLESVAAATIIVNQRDHGGSHKEVYEVFVAGLKDRLREMHFASAKSEGSA